MIANEVVLKVVATFHGLSVPYMLVGSYSSNLYGIGRSTQDVDFVVEASDSDFTQLFSKLRSVVRFDPQLRLESVTMTTRFVGEHLESGFKVELCQLTNDAHDQARFARRTLQPFLTDQAYLPTAEDVLIQKLRWARLARKAKDLQDATNIIAVQAASLDYPYIRQWCDLHQTRELLEELIKKENQP